MTDPNNPLGLDGFAFCEFTSPEPDVLSAQFEQLGFVPAARVPERGLTLYRPHCIAGSMAFMFETRHVIRPTRWASETPTAQLDYDAVWSGFAKARLPR